MTAEKTILRTAKGAQRPYFVMARSTAQDSTLSFEARGLLGYLLSKPDDWKVEVPDLMREGAIGRDKAKGILKELRDAGYIITEMLVGKDGRFTGKIDRIHDTAVLKNRLTENQDIGNPQLHNTEVTEEEKEESVEPNGSTPRKPQSKSKTVRSTPVSQAELHPERTEAEWAVIRQQRIEESTAQTNRQIKRDADEHELYQIVFEEWGFKGDANSFAGTMVRYFQCTPSKDAIKKKDEWALLLPDEPINPQDLRAWVALYRHDSPGMNLPGKPTILQGRLNAWIARGKPTVYSSNGSRASQPIAPAPQLSDSDRAELAEKLRAAKAGIANG